jgi:hypothetical protein
MRFWILEDAINRFMENKDKIQLLLLNVISLYKGKEGDPFSCSLKAIKKKLKKIQGVFGIEDEELNLDSGPLGNLM